jgi:predicted nucleic acid-binding Zn ribbon protein
MAIGKVLYHYFCPQYYMAESTTPAGYNYTCNECGASFEAMEDLTKHCRQDHTESQ